MLFQFDFYYYDKIPKAGLLYEEWRFIWLPILKFYGQGTDIISALVRPQGVDTTMTGAHVREIISPDKKPESSKWLVTTFLQAPSSKGPAPPNIATLEDHAPNT